MTLDLTDEETWALLNLLPGSCQAVVFALNWETIDAMARDTALALHALTYVIRLHADLTSEHGAPTLGTQNQAVDFILADPDLSRAVATWAAMTNLWEAAPVWCPVPSRRLSPN